MRKRIGFLAIIGAILIAAFMVGQDDAITAEKPKGVTYSSAFQWSVAIDSDGVLGVSYDSTYATSGGGKIFYFRGLENYSTLNAAIYVEVTSLDTGIGGAVVADTGEDSMSVRIFAGYGGTSWNRKIYEDSIMKAESHGDTLYIPLSDSVGAADRIWFEFITCIADTTAILHDANANVHYKATVRMTAK